MGNIYDEPIEHETDGDEGGEGEGDYDDSPFAEYSIDITPQEVFSSDDVILYDTSDYTPIGEESEDEAEDDALESR